MLYWPAKAPGETEDFAFDFTGVLAPGEAITSETVSGVGVTVDSSAIAGALVRAWLSGGTAGTVAKVTCTIVTNSVPPRTYSEVAVLAIGGESIELTTAKAAQRIDGDDEDALLRGFLRAAVRSVEKAIGKNLTAQVERQVIDGFPGSIGAAHLYGIGGAYGSAGYYGYPRLGHEPAIRLWKGPVSEILEVKYDDPDGVERALSSFRLVEAGATGLAKLVPAFGECWPATALGAGTVRISYVAGYDPTDRDLQAVVEIVLLLFGHFNANREAVIASERAATAELPLGVAMLLDEFRTPGIG